MTTKEIPQQANLRMSRIKNVIKVTNYLIASSIIVLLVGGSMFLADLAGFGIFPEGVKVSFSPLLTYSSPFKIPAVVLGLGLVRAGLFFAGALILLRWLGLVQTGKFFVSQSVCHIKWLGYLVISDWVLTKVLDFIASGITFSFSQLVLGLLIVLIAWVMDEARKIQEEQELTV